MPWLLVSSALFSVPALAADDLPSGAGVAAGQVGVTSSGNSMTITQTSDRAIVNWGSFNIGAGNSVKFHQPGSGSAILNRVTGSTPSSIAGTLSANGEVFLVNPNGIAITPTGVVSTGGGFVASTLGIADSDFMSGSLNFSGSGASSTVSNSGVITVGHGGYAALLGGKVRNDGLIAVPFGKAGLGAGEAITLDLSGDGFMQVSVPSSLVDDGEALIENSGTVSTEGGTIVMRAATARNAARKAINMSGVAEARSVSGRNGKITLGGGRGGSVQVSGKVSTRAKKATSSPSTQEGGVIEITGATVAAEDAVLDASGFGNGGTIRLGGHESDANALQRATTLTISDGTMITADALDGGNGGTVVLWSDDYVGLSGTVSARGAGDGNGGRFYAAGARGPVFASEVDLGASQAPSLMSFTTAQSVLLDTVPAGASHLLTTAVVNKYLNQLDNPGSLVIINNENNALTIAGNLSWDTHTVFQISSESAVNIAGMITGTGEYAGLFLDNMTMSPGAVITMTGTGATVNERTSNHLIRTAADLQAINAEPAEDYYLVQDIDLSGTTYTAPLIAQLTGKLNGFGHTISNFTLAVPSGADSNFGLVGQNSGTISYLSLVNASVSARSDNSTGSYAGLLVGTNEDRGDITGVTVSGTASIYGDAIYSNLGGLAGMNNGTISNSIANVTLEAKNNYNSSRVGGLVGLHTGIISTSSAGGNITGRADLIYAGGLVGAQLDGTLSSSYATGNVVVVPGAQTMAGGLIGYTNGGSVADVYATGNVTGTNGTASVSLGGLIGSNSVSVSRAFSTGNVSWSGSATPSDGLDLGGFAGYNDGTITASFYNTDTSGQPHAGAGVSGVTGMTSAQFADPYYFTGTAINAGWDFTGSASQSQSDQTMPVWAQPINGETATLYRPYQTAWIFGQDVVTTYGDSTVTLSQPLIFAAAANVTSSVTTLSLSTAQTTVLGSSNFGRVDIGGQTYFVITDQIDSGASFMVNPYPIQLDGPLYQKPYGVDLPLSQIPYYFSSGSLFSGDVLTGTLASNGAPASALLGQYDISLGTLSNPNYNISFDSGVMTVYWGRPGSPPHSAESQAVQSDPRVASAVSPGEKTETDALYNIQPGAVGPVVCWVIEDCSDAATAAQTEVAREN
ncbi:filamentous hemagglutinin family protein [Martelella radicis]|uniref:Filamentous hemagglutinin family protein n=1 Tax=Martelella radicis TaxID=1397476 RepID=A0A7W6P9R9_9HYPH|nr:filamentous hemagglutinin family protein [Martelella radicis]